MEVLLAISIMGVLSSIAIPNYLKYIENARSTACRVERGITDKMIILFCNENNDNPLANLSQLVSAGYTNSQPQCAYGGEYVLIPVDETHNYQRVGCSLHYWPGEEAENPLTSLTSLGSTFEEISASMISLVQKFYDENGRYPRSWGDYVYTDIGLDPDEWSEAFNGIMYSPSGDSIKVTPAEGYIFYVTGSDGEEKVLKSSNNWSLWYSMEDQEWYYHKIKDKNEIDISTLRVEKD